MQTATIMGIGRRMVSRIDSEGALVEKVNTITPTILSIHLDSRIVIILWTK
jgi:hypothetical protein